jgi:hypothetical protein
MAGSSRTLKLSILADVDQLNKSLKAANSDVEDSSNKMLDFGKKAGLAFAAAAAAAGAYAIKIGIDGVKAAIEDEKSQSKLFNTLQNVTMATDEQLASVEKQILKMSLASGVADDQLRPALSRLAISTGDITKAQDLLSVALDVSTATGKPLETVANAIGKAYDGNTAALGKLGVGLSSAELKTMDFTQVQQRLSDLFGGAAAANAETFAGRMEILKVTINEAKEGIGYALLPILEKLVGYFTEYVVPIVEKLSNAFSNKEGGLTSYITTLGQTISNVFTPIWNGLVKAFGYVKDAIGENIDTFKTFGVLISTYVAPVIGTVLGGALQVAGAIAAGVIDVIAGVVKILNGLISGAVAGINALISAYNSIPFLPNVGKISAPSVSVQSVSIPKSVAPSIPTVPTVPKITVPSVASPAVAAAASTTATASTATNVVTGSFNAGSFRAAEAASSGTVINLTVTGAFDSEGTARTIVETLNNSYYRGGGGGANSLVAV